MQNELHGFLRYIEETLPALGVEVGAVSTNENVAFGNLDRKRFRRLAGRIVARGDVDHVRFFVIEEVGYLDRM